MKKTILNFCIAIAVVTNIHVYAGGGGIGGGLCMTALGPCGSEATELGTKISTFLNTSANVKSMLKDTILDPLANQIISSTLQSSVGDINSWIGGGFEGNPLIVADPTKYITNEGLAVARNALGSIPANSAFGDSIFSSLVGQYKDSGDLTAKISSLSSSEVPSLVQKNMCSDAGLNTLAVQDVGENDQAAVNARKIELYNYVCKKDPKTDIVTAKRLTDLAEQRPTLGGWDKWLAVTGGDNTFTASQKVAVEVAQKVAEEKEKAKNDIYSGAGPVSQTKCTKYANTTSLGEVASCLEKTVVTPAKTVEALLAKANTSGISRLENIQGSGALSAILTSLVSDFISGSFGAKSGGTSGMNTSVVFNSTRPVVQDLADDPKRKEQNSAPMLDQINYYDSMLTKLQQIDRDYIADLGAYETKIYTGRRCYTLLVSDEKLSLSDPRYTSASNFYASRQAKIDTVKSSLSEEMNKINQAKSLIIKTTASLKASNSTQELSTIFDTYRSTITSEKMPAMDADGTRQSEYMEQQGQVAADTTIDDYQKTCNQLNSTGYSI